jgi:catechol 2,3-dioxygenase-like lactoylglutathione lyase family enzyme
MTVQLQIAIDCRDPLTLADFWAKALGYRVEAGIPDGWAAVVDPGEHGPRLLFHRVPEGKIVKNRLHLDVRVGGPRGTAKQIRRPLVDADAERLRGLGATHLRTEDDEADYFVVMQDPEGNEFCLC